MSLLSQCEKKKIHNRNIGISSYSWDADHVLIVGELKEQREVGFINQFDEEIRPGVYHHMKIELLIATRSMTIKDIEVTLPKVPRGDCPSMTDSLDSIKGMKISRGFSKIIKQMVGGCKGCVHLNTLLLAMAPAAMQGSWVNIGWNGKYVEKSSTEVLESLVDSCWAWRKDGSLVEEMEQRFGKDARQQQ